MTATELRRAEVLLWTLPAMKVRPWPVSAGDLKPRLPGRATVDEIREAMKTLEQLGYCQQAGRGRWEWLPEYARR